MASITIVLIMQVYRDISNVHCAECPSGFMYQKVGSHAGCYKISPAKKYSEAGPECAKLDPRAHLVIITSQDEMDAVKSVISWNNGECYLMLYFRIIYRYNMWLGAVV